MLLPDGRVLTAGGTLPGGTPTIQQSAMIFWPPYLFKGSRPVITSVPSQLKYGRRFKLLTPEAQSIAKVNLLRLGAVTHEFDQDQRCVPLKFRVFNDSSLRVSAPANGNVAPPGYYMLFIISRDGVPSMARYVHVRRLPSVSVP